MMKSIYCDPKSIFLENKGYAVDTASNGADALELCENNFYDVVFLDETMPGMGGLDTLAKMKEINNHLPVVMITKNEEEDLMDSAIGAQISDYLIKPVNPKQILLTLKRILNSSSLVKEANGFCISTGICSDLFTDSEYLLISGMVGSLQEARVLGIGIGAIQESGNGRSLQHAEVGSQ